MSRLVLHVDGRRTEVDADPMDRLLDVLRDACGAKGVREGCGEGECGSCTVLLDGAPVCACLVPVFQAEDGEVVTAAGVIDAAGGDALASAMLEEGGVQCGACTPGIAVAAHALLASEEKPGRDDVRDALAGNLCRCTGYERVLRAVLKAAGATEEAP